MEGSIRMREREVDVPGEAGHETYKARIAYLVCEPIEQAGFINAFSTRLGGVSQLPADALNLAYFKGEDKEKTDENRRRFLEAIGARQAIIVTARQTHSTKNCFIESIEQAKQCAIARGLQLNCDAMATKLAGVLLAIQTADCLPILIADPETKTVAAIHAGWRGTAGRIIERTIAALMKRGLNPRTSIAALGPAACVDCYEVGEDVIKRYQKEFGYWRKLIVNFKQGGKAYLDIRAAALQQLAFCGFTPDRIHSAPYCTMHHNELFFSHRREGKGNVGRLLSVIGRI
jgi:YfiH family protein